MRLGDNMDYRVLSDPKKIYDSMILDIRSARKEILLETYIYHNDSVGKRFLEELVKKAQQGVQVRVLIDSWDSDVNRKFFKRLIDAGGKVRFFREIRYVLKFFNANHERNHRKLLIVDEKVSYIGSINITATCLNWEELVLRIRGNITSSFRHSFYQSWRRFNLWDVKQMKKIIHKSFEILQDFPSGKYGVTEKRYRRLIKSAEKEVLIVTPYFVPSIRIRNSFRKAIKKGVQVKIVLPKYSAVRFLDIFMGRYLGTLHKMGVQIYYHPKTIHSKLLIVDDKFFLLGSSNVNFRSFLHSFEINLLGSDKQIIFSLKKHFTRLIGGAKTFNYENWLERHFFIRLRDDIVEKLARPFEEYL